MEVVEGLAKTTLSEIEKVLGTKTLVGEPINAKDTTLVPLISVGFGFGAGGGIGTGEAKQKVEGLGGYSTGGAFVKPVAVIIVDKQGVKIEPIKGGLSTAIERIGEAIPKAIEKGFEKWRERSKSET